MKSPPVTIDYDTSISSQPFHWDEFLSNLQSKSSDSGFLIPGAVQSREYNINVAFGDFDGEIQDQRIGLSTVWNKLTL